eukprot:TRINITY_DN136_c0_g1_i2.p1 TRINITY_DN136_c0_g1~~TRINITY_DN136_c0_g1_i2.p1  ORF type:complete len:234 (-),score=24.14 TRINITY_DN136_c0_g1_i2:324-1025(-)
MHVRCLSRAPLRICSTSLVPVFSAHSLSVLSPVTKTKISTVKFTETKPNAFQTRLSWISKTQRRRYCASSSPSSRTSPNWSDRPPIETAPLFPGCDYEHWLIVMKPLNGGNASKEEMIDYYIKTLAKVLGSEEAAKKSIYNVSCERYFGFGCEIDEETSNKLVGLPGVQFVLPDSYVDPEYKDYGGELLVDGKIVPRSPERQKRVTPAPQRFKSDRPRYSDRTRYVRRKREYE